MEMPTEEEMLPKDKYTVFDRKVKRYRKGIHSESLLRSLMEIGGLKVGGKTRMGGGIPIARISVSNCVCVLTGSRGTKVDEGQPETQSSGFLGRCGELYIICYYAAASKRRMGRTNSTRLSKVTFQCNKEVRIAIKEQTFSIPTPWPHALNILLILSVSTSSVLAMLLEYIRSILVSFLSRRHDCELLSGSGQPNQPSSNLLQSNSRRALDLPTSFPFVRSFVRVLDLAFNACLQDALLPAHRQIRAHRRSTFTCSPAALKVTFTLIRLQHRYLHLQKSAIASQPLLRLHPRNILSTFHEHSYIIVHNMTKPPTDIPPELSTEWLALRQKHQKESTDFQHYVGNEKVEFDRKAEVARQRLLAKHIGEEQQFWSKHGQTSHIAKDPANTSRMKAPRTATPAKSAATPLAKASVPGSATSKVQKQAGLSKVSQQVRKTFKQAVFAKKRPGACPAQKKGVPEVIDLCSSDDEDDQPVVQKDVVAQKPAQAYYTSSKAGEQAHPQPTFSIPSASIELFGSSSKKYQVDQFLPSHDQRANRNSIIRRSSHT
jgi:hypothetical protein